MFMLAALALATSSETYTPRTWMVLPVRSFIAQSADLANFVASELIEGFVRECPKFTRR